MTHAYGKRLRLNRLFKRGTGRLLAIPLDHSLTDGPVTSPAALASLIRSVDANGADAVVLHKGRARCVDPRCLATLSLIVHLSGSTSRAPDPDDKVLLGSVEEAVRLGADAVSVHVNLGSATEARQLSDLGSVAGACDHWGMPLLAMMYDRGAAPGASGDPKSVAHLASVAVDLGADMVKTVFAGTVDQMREVVRSCPVPILVAGGSPYPERASLLDFVGRVVDCGAAGLAIGRNIFNADAPGELTRQIADRLHGAGAASPGGRAARSARRSIAVPGLGHGTTPIPLGSRVGPVVFSSAIGGNDPDSGELPGDPDQEVARAFRNLELFLRAAGAAPEDVVHVRATVTDDVLRKAMDREWVELFPDEASRPARHTTVAPLRAGRSIQLEVAAVTARSELGDGAY